jgi:hypothetical protein
MLTFPNLSFGRPGWDSRSGLVVARPRGTGEVEIADRAGVNAPVEEPLLLG